MKITRWIACAGVVAYIAGAAASAAPAAVPAGLNPLRLPEWTMTASGYGPTLLLSDSPEMVSADGILYEDTVQGDVRLFFHHVNAMKDVRRVVVLLENPAESPVRVTVTRHGLGGPGKDYLAVGKAAQRAYMGHPALYLVEAPAKGAAPLDYLLSDTLVRPGELLNGIYDFTADAPVRVRVLMLPEGEDAKQFAAKARVLPPDQHRLRGTFAGGNRMLIPDKVYRPEEDGPVVVTLADNNLDQYVRGIDATTGEPTVNYGNYGVVYRLFLPTGGDGLVDGWLNPRGGYYAGVLSMKYRQEREVTVDTPAGRTGFGEGLGDYAKLGTFAAGQSLWLSFSPPGASNLPVKLIMAPTGK